MNIHFLRNLPQKLQLSGVFVRKYIWILLTNDLYQVWLKLAEWFWRRRWDSDQRQVFGSGELKPTKNDFIMVEEHTFSRKIKLEKKNTKFPRPKFLEIILPLNTTTSKVCSIFYLQIGSFVSISEVVKSWFIYYYKTIIVMCKYIADVN